MMKHRKFWSMGRRSESALVNLLLVVVAIPVPIWAFGDPPSVAPATVANADGNQELFGRRIERPAASRIEPWTGPPGRTIAATGGGVLRFDFLTVNVAPEGDAATELAFTVDGSMIVIAHRDSQNLVLLDADTRIVLRTIPLSGSPNSLALSSDNVHAVTANLFEDTASIVDLILGQEVAVVPVGEQPGVVRITPDGATAIVGNTVDSDLSVIDIVSATELRRIPGAGFWQSTAGGSFAINYEFTDYEIAPDNDTIVFPELFNDQISFFSIGTGNATSVASQPGPAVVDLSPDGTVAVVSHHYPSSLVSVVDMASQTITKTILIGGEAFLPPVAINPEKTKAVVEVLNNVRFVDLVTGTVSADLYTGAVERLVRSSDGQYCAVGNFMGSLVSFATESIVGNFLSTTTPEELAVSPADPRAATAHLLRKEFTEVMNIDGALGFFEGAVPTGPPPEGDKARGVAVSANGYRAVVINNHSHNATIMDLEDGTITGVAPVGERPGGVAITPDGNTAVIANLDSTFASVVDLATAATTNVGISRRGGRVAISPDGVYAYIAVVANGDGVWRIHLPTLAIDGPRILTGNMGGIGFIFDQGSGMTLSHDGATLATCGSFDDNVSIIDTASWSEVARVPVGDFPVRAAFSPDDSTLYVTNKSDDTVSVVANDGPVSSVTAVIGVGAAPFELVSDPTGNRLYVANFNDRSVSVIDTTTNTVIDTIAIPQTGGAGQPVGLQVSSDAAWLYVAANGADFHLIDTASGSITNTINTGLAPTMLVFNDATSCGYMPCPLGGDGLSRVCVTDGLIFADGFESGDLSAWSSSEP